MSLQKHRNKNRSMHPLVPPASKVPSTCTSAGWPGCEATRLAAHSESAVPSEKVSASKSFTATVLVGHGPKKILVPRILYPCFSTKWMFPILHRKWRSTSLFLTHNLSLGYVKVDQICHILWISIFIFTLRKLSKIAELLHKEESPERLPIFLTFCSPPQSCPAIGPGRRWLQHRSLTSLPSEPP